MKQTVLACDLGGATFRAGLVDAAGAVTAFAAEPSGSAAHERAPEDWWRGLERLVAALAERDAEGLSAVAAVAITGFTRTQVLLDAALRPVRPAIMFSDSRAEALMEEIRARAPAAHPETAGLNAFHPLARLFWLGRREPDRLAAAVAVVDPKDYLNAMLTGRVVSDPISAARLSASAGLFGALGLRGDLAPEILAPGRIIGPVRADAPGALGRLAGAPVVSLAHDTWAAALGLGAMRAGRAYDLSGTTEVFGVFSREPAAADGLMSVAWGRGAHQLGGPSQCGGDTLLWALGLLTGGAVAPGEAGAAAARILAGPRSEAPLLFLPYLNGERTPWWDPALRGGFIGLDRAHGPADCLYAVMEGVAFLNQIVLERAEAAIGRPVSEIRFGGGGAASPVWAQIKADICARPVLTTRAAEPGLIGCAAAALTALGRFASLDAAQDAMVAIRRRHAPDAGARARYERLRPLFLAAHHALAPISAALGRSGAP
ncbi:FGGY-family carbohydrate kinase [Pikeienuella sp. HZG-20]|uniref:xylulokinase n=1 Tax=Paludibacillus litoralis TaxID=3133267 RepID=UPI0030ED600E